MRGGPRSRQPDLGSASHSIVLGFGGTSKKTRVEAFAAASGVGEDKMPSTEALLERKWASLFRLQKKNGELEAKAPLLGFCWLSAWFRPRAAADLPSLPKGLPDAG